MKFSVYLIAVLTVFATPALAERLPAEPLSLSLADSPPLDAGEQSAAERLFEYQGGSELGLSPRQGAGADLFRSGGFRAGLTALAPDRRDVELGLAPLGLQNEGLEGEVGAFAEYGFDDFKVTATARRDLGGSQGAQVEVGFGYGAKLSPDASLSVGPTIGWTSGGFRDNPLGADSMMLGRRDSDAGVDVGASVVVNWHFLDNWSLTGVAGAKQLIGDSADLALESQSDATELFTGFAFGYRF